MEHIARNYQSMKYVFKTKYGNFLNMDPVKLAPLESGQHTVRSLLFPDMLAPSTNFIAPTITDTHAYDRFEGPSSAVAYFAGATALLLQTHRDRPLNFVTVKQTFQRRAIQLYDEDHDRLVPYAYQGAGLLHLAKAAVSVIAPDPNIIRFGFHATDRVEKGIWLTNIANAKQYVLTDKHATPILVDENGVTRMVSRRESENWITVDMKRVVNAQLHQTWVDIAVRIGGNIPPGYRLVYSGYIIVDVSRGAHIVPSEDATSIPFYGEYINGV
ncbi:hypothetical protein SYNPS1DRAFT_20858 [Syncephalis pseudoplumigaleata]|uniref:Peptidase S8/S53 domain-containing protein n=1 Tax=Syncephalis pseudoplumigaleata TaxID=1712513 RepID=A0A4P9Z725_9FUNG|nr:hypothetical protein SYNPS1DRAFT_20858 [Syncephalis pseudoplumigaleata]|eukprot:RKP27681.1 hypothetical protein SYNPS1DRAFT_20858 [Syncephalis pseudoplumigaleata]